MTDLFRACGLTAALLCSTAATAAAQSAPAPAASAVPEIGHVVTSDRQDEPLGATARTTFVVTKAEMIRYGYATVAAALGAVPGVVVERYGAAGAGATISIRGSSTSGVLVLLDGRPAGGAQLGGVDLGAYPTTGVERIEVVEGSGATLYGSGAEGGVVNIITARRNAAYRTPFVTLATGSFGERAASFENSFFSFERRVATNAYDYSATDGAPAGTRRNADLQSTAVRFGGAASLGAVALSGSAGLVARALGVPGSTAFLTASARQHDVNEDLRLGATLQHGRASTSLDLAATRSAIAFRDPDPAEFGPTDNLSVEARVQASLRNVVASEAGRLVYGIDLAHGIARNDGGNGVFAAVPFAQTAAYVQDSLRVGRTSRLYAGLRGERDGAAGAALTPSLGGIVGLGEGFALRVNGATAFRVPTAVDLTFPGFSNPDLRPEHTRSFDVTLDQTRVLGGISAGWFVQTAADLIVLNPAADFTLPFGPLNEPLINAQRTSVAGFVIDLATARRNSFGARFSVTDTYRALAFQPGMPATRLPDRPVFAGNVEAGYEGPADARIAAWGIAAHSTSRRTDGTGTTGAYGRLDAFARIRLAPQALISLRGFNLTNARYAELPGYPAPGPGFALELSTR